MKQELAQDIALMRYSMISPLIVGLPDEYKSKEIRRWCFNPAATGRCGRKSVQRKRHKRGRQ